MLASLSLALAAAVAAPPASADLVAVQAGTIHVVPGERVIEGGGTLVLRDGKVVAAGKTGEVQVPAGARVVDYGPEAVVVPGFVAADSSFGRQFPGERTADVGVRAIDNFDPYASYASTLASGVTTAYLPPARGRLISGQGAVVKLAGGTDASRIVSASAAIEGSISADARNTPGYWEPPIPATVDVGIGVEQKQLPRTTMGAIVALRELLALAKDKSASDEYGPHIGPELAELVKAKRPWCMRAEDEDEIRALLGFFGENGLPLVVTGAGEAGEVAEEIAKSGAAVIWNVPVRPNASPVDRGKGEDDEWPSYDVAAKLAKAGVRFAIAPPGSANRLYFAAQMAARGGLSGEAALRAITLTPAEILGVADRVGSLAPGRDADLVVLNGPPLSGGSGVVETWVGGEVAYEAAAGTAEATAATVISVDELHVGDGTVIAPAEVLLKDGRIVEVGRTVSRPAGCKVVRGAAAMPGMIDARGHLGLEGSGKAPNPRFELKRLIEPGDRADRRVALAGVTTVVLTPRGTNSSGTPVMAYKPAGEELSRMVVADPAAVAVQWSPENRVDRLEAGKSVRELLEKAAEYKQKWDDYEKEIAEWTPPPPEPEADEEDEDEADEDEGEEEDEDAEEEDEDADEGPAPLTGSWETRVTDPATGEETRLRIRILDEDGSLEGTLRCDAVSSELVELTGTSSEGGVQLSGRGTRGRVTVEGTVHEVEKKKKKKKKKDEEAEDEEPERRRLEGKVATGGVELEFDAPQVSEEYPVARRPERRKVAEEEPDEPKGKPKSPGINADLEPLRHALEGKVAIVVEVHRSDEILACVAAFEKHGIEPVLYGAGEAWKVGDQLRGRVAGVLLDHQVTWSDAEMGTRVRNRYAELQNAGIPVAFHSSAEEGAVDLPAIAAFAVSEGMSAAGALRALTSDAAAMFHLDSRVGRLASGLDGDIVLLDGSPLDISSGVVRVWVAGREVRR